MAEADYKSCDKCGGRTFYDSNLHYDDEWDNSWGRPYGVGDWGVLCKECAKGFKVVVEEKAKLMGSRGKKDE
jgi:hypothetical protein